MKTAETTKKKYYILFVCAQNESQNHFVKKMQKIFFMYQLLAMDFFKGADS